MARFKSFTPKPDGKGGTLVVTHEDEKVGHADRPETTHEVAENCTVAIDGVNAIEKDGNTLPTPIADLREGMYVGLAGSPICMINATRDKPKAKPPTP